MEILFIGYSNLFKNRILPVLNALDFFSKISIAKYETQDWDDAYKKADKPVTLYDDFQSALENFKGDLVYISTTNHSHYHWAKKSLEAGFNTIVDKPATLLLSETVELIEIAKSKNLLLSESTVYLYHPQFYWLESFIKENGFVPKHITFLFSFPPLDINNFRYSKNLGGGAILDTSAYVASIGRFFFEEIPLECKVSINAKNDKVDTSYSFLLTYPNGKSIVGHSGFTTEYINRINVLGENISIDIDRVFTLPENVENPIHVRSKNNSETHITASGNMFREYFIYIEKCLQNKTYNELYEKMNQDAQVRELLINNSH